MLRLNLGDREVAIVGAIEVGMRSPSELLQSFMSRVLIMRVDALHGDGFGYDSIEEMAP